MCWRKFILSLRWIKKTSIRSRRWICGRAKHGDMAYRTTALCILLLPRESVFVGPFLVGFTICYLYYRPWLQKVDKNAYTSVSCDVVSAVDTGFRFDLDEVVQGVGIVDERGEAMWLAERLCGVPHWHEGGSTGSCGSMSLQARVEVQHVCASCGSYTLGMQADPETAFIALQWQLHDLLKLFVLDLLLCQGSHDRSWLEHFFCLDFSTFLSGERRTCITSVWTPNRAGRMTRESLRFPRCWRCLCLPASWIHIAWRLKIASRKVIYGVNF